LNGTVFAASVIAKARKTNSGAPRDKRLTRKTSVTRRIWILAVVVSAGFVAFAANAARLLVVDAPQPSDVILVLAGETDRRPARALELLRRGYGRRVVIDVPAAARVYEVTQVKLAEEYIRSLPHAE
jgi:hypothetical protein